MNPPSHPFDALMNQNGLLAALPAEVRARLLPAVTLVTLTAGGKLDQPGTKGLRAYFPLAGLISIIQELPDGTGGQIAVVGREGVVGWPLFMSGDSESTPCLVQSDGYGFALARDVLVEEFGRAGAFMRQLLRFTQALMAQTGQFVVCNRHHSIEQQLCRLLLMSFDRMPAPEIAMTHEAASHLLGVRREGITEASRRLREAGVIACRRGVFAALNRSALEAKACECYGLVKNEYLRLLPVCRPHLEAQRQSPEVFPAPPLVEPAPDKLDWRLAAAAQLVAAGLADAPGCSRMR